MKRTKVIHYENALTTNFRKKNFFYNLRGAITD